MATHKLSWTKRTFAAANKQSHFPAPPYPPLSRMPTRFLCTHDTETVETRLIAVARVSVVRISTTSAPIL